MEFVNLLSGDRMPACAFGTGTAWYRPEGSDEARDPKLRASIKSALGAGFKHLDSAEMYTNEAE